MISAPLPEGAAALGRRAQGARAAASALRFFAACAIAFSGLFALALALASFERSGAEPPAELSASAYLDFDLSVLRALADRSLPATSDAEHRALLQMWSLRPPWQLPHAPAGGAHLVSLRDAFSATVSGRSHFRTAARGALGALPYLLCALALGFAAAALAGVAAQIRHRNERVGGLAALALSTLLPLWTLVDPSVFHDRARTLGSGLLAVLFVAAFAGTLPGAAARALFGHAGHAQHLSAFAGRPALGVAARLAALDAADWLLPLLPALAAAAMFVCAKADQGEALGAATSGLGALVRAAMQEPSVAERMAACALVGGALVVLWFLAYRFVMEMRAALRVAG